MYLEHSKQDPIFDMSNIICNDLQDANKETNPTTAQGIETIITSRPINYYNKAHEVKSSKTIHLQSTRKSILNHRDGRPGVVILGDSHARGIASELLKQSNHQVSATGYVKPNSGLTELLRSAKSDINKLSRRDVVVYA